MMLQIANNTLTKCIQTGIRKLLELSGQTGSRVYSVCVGGWGEAAGKVLTLGLLTAYEIHPGFVFSSTLLNGIQ